MVSGWVLGIFRVRSAAQAESDIRTGDGGALEKTHFGNVVSRKHVQADGFVFGQRLFSVLGWSSILWGRNRTPTVSRRCVRNTAACSWS